MTRSFDVIVVGAGHAGCEAALALPSLLSMSELNFLLNPNHPDFKRIKINGPIEYHFDPRMARR